MQLTSFSGASLHRVASQFEHRRTISGICPIDYEFLRFITHSSRLRKPILYRRCSAEQLQRPFGWFGNSPAAFDACLASIGTHAYSAQAAYVAAKTGLLSMND
jgi:hypothetical protein